MARELVFTPAYFINTTWKVSRGTKFSARCDSRRHQDLRYLVTGVAIREEPFGH